MYEINHAFNYRWDAIWLAFGGFGSSDDWAEVVAKRSPMQPSEVATIIKEACDVHAGRAVYGYEGRAVYVGSRVELHPGCDLWMRGARFGVIVSLASIRPHVGSRVGVRMDHPQVRKVQHFPADRVRASRYHG